MTINKRFASNYYVDRFAAARSDISSHPYFATPDGASGGGGYTVVDSDAATYITAVETADGESLEDGVKEAVDVFVQGCKTDGIWADMTDVVLLAGARTLSGCLVPLKGTAPTNNNFVSGDYSRSDGLTGNGTTKYLATNTLDTDYPQDDYHQACWVSTLGTTGEECGISTGGGNADSIMRTSSGLFRTRVNDVNHTHSQTPEPGFIGFSRGASNVASARLSGVTDSVSQRSATIGAGLERVVFALFSTSVVNYFDGQIAFYSFGTDLSLADLDSRVGTLLTSIDTALA